MSRQPDSTDPGPDSGAAAGVESTLDSGLAESDAQGEQLGDADLQSGTEGRSDPDDPEASIEEATERSRGQD